MEAAIATIPYKATLAVSQLKKFVESASNMAVAKQMLVFEGQALEDERTVGEYVASKSKCVSDSMEVFAIDARKEVRMSFWPYWEHPPSVQTAPSHAVCCNVSQALLHSLVTRATAASGCFWVPAMTRHVVRCLFGADQEAWSAYKLAEVNKKPGRMQLLLSGSVPCLRGSMLRCLNVDQRQDVDGKEHRGLCAAVGHHCDAQTLHL